MATTTTTTVLITGNTYPVKEQLKALGGRWNAEAKGWMVPSDKADEAQALVSGGGGSASNSKSSGSRSPRKCCACGVVQTFNSRGYPNIKIYRSGECQDCFEERKMGD